MMTFEAINETTAVATNSLKPVHIVRKVYPIVIESYIYQYDEGVFVWFDETGGVGGASNYLEEARAQMKRYAESL